MKNKLIIIAAIFAFVAGANAQNTDEAKNVLRLCREKCQSIRGGHYDVEYRIKYMDYNDTITSNYSCDFIKKPDDEVFGKLFHTIKKTSNRTKYEIYTGDELVYGSEKELKRIPCVPYIDEVIAQRHYFNFYKPLTEKEASPLPSDEVLADSTIEYTLTDSIFDGKTCYWTTFTRRNVHTTNNTTGIETLATSIQVCIDKQNYLPLLLSLAIEMKEMQDTICQYEIYKLLNFDTTINENRFTLEGLPTGATIEDYVPEKTIKPLGKGKRAPEWTLPTIAGDSISFTDLKGKIVLIDFFYKKCAPCNAAVPTLLHMYEKYKDQGLVIIGIDPYDDPIKDEMADFLAKRSIDYTVVFSDRKLPEEYRVTGYPTLFFINRKGKIEKVHEGFDPSMIEEIEAQIIKMLKKQ